MATEVVVAHGMPGNDFWQKFTTLWQSSAERSPFNSPHILQYFAGKVQENLVVFQFFKDGELRGVILLKKSKGTYTFLSDLKTDVNFFVLDRHCAPADERQFFEYFLQTAKREKWSLALNNQPSWAGYMPTLEAAGQKSGLFWLNLAYSVCPVAEAQSPEALFDRVRNTNKFRYYATRISKMPGAAFEVFQDNTDLELWTEEYCQAHIRRWANTPTPSDFRDAQRREFLLGCLRAWNNDGVLVRFSIKLPTGRIGFVIGLLEEQSLVFHATTFDPGYAKYSPGKALIYYIASWMVGQQIRILDFGDGNEAYKYEVADQERVLNRIFISGKNQIPFIAKVKFIKYVKDHPKVYHLYQNKVKPWAVKAAAALHFPEILGT